MHDDPIPDPIPDVTTLDPLYDRLIVEPDPTNEISAGGVFLPTGVRSKPDTGEVVAIGPGRLDNFGITHPMPVQPGEKVLYHQHAGVEIKVDGSAYIILNSGDVIAVIRTAEQREALRQAAAAKSPDPRPEG